MPKLRPGTIIPTAEEDAAIAAGIAADPDTAELSAVDFAGLQPVRRGRPKLAAAKQAVKLRLDPDVIEGFRSLGAGWQSRINEALRAALHLPK